MVTIGTGYHPSNLLHFKYRKSLAGDQFIVKVLNLNFMTRGGWAPSLPSLIRQEVDVLFKHHLFYFDYIESL